MKYALTPAAIFLLLRHTKPNTMSRNITLRIFRLKSRTFQNFYSAISEVLNCTGILPISKKPVLSMLTDDKNPAFREFCSKSGIRPFGKG